MTKLYEITNIINFILSGRFEGELKQTTGLKKFDLFKIQSISASNILLTYIKNSPPLIQHCCLHFSLISDRKIPQIYP